MYDHAHPQHLHPHSSRPFLFALLLTLSYAAVEAVAGLWANSLALLGDAGHMATDGAALALAALAAWLAQRPASRRHTYGLGRMEVIAALINTLFMFAVVTGITLEAFSRLQHPPAVDARVVMLVGFIGLVINIVVYRVLRHGAPSLNTRAALLHVLGDMLGSVAAFAAGLVIWLTGWLPIDPLLSLFIAVLILISSLRLLRDAGQVLLEGVPRGMNLAEIGTSMAGIAGVHSVHDLHIWSLSSNEASLSAHVVIDDMDAWLGTLSRLREHLLQRYGIEHATLQPEPAVLARIPLESLIRRP